MPRKKLQRFKELNRFPNVVQVTQRNFKKKLKSFLAHKKKTILELGCGKGEYTLALAKMFPDKKFIGLDIQGERLWFGAKTALAEKLNNVFFLRVQAENLLSYFPKKSIEEIWLTFPDPYPTKRQAKKRLTSPTFLKIYKTLLQPNGLVHLKTDDAQLFASSLKNIQREGIKLVKKIKNLYHRRRVDPILSIKTCYENKHLNNGKKINYLAFRFK